jgi:methylmalonyl-CoA mutase
MLTPDFFNGFKPQTAEDWKAQFIKDLKGKAEPDTQGFTDVDGFFMPAFQNQETVSDIAYLQNFAEFVAANKKAGWQYAEPIWFESETQTNADIKAAVAGGAEAIVLYIADAEELNPGKLFNGISLKDTAIHFVVGNEPGSIVYALNQYYPGLGSIKGSLNFLPINEQLTTPQLLKEYATMLKLFPINNKFRPLVVSSAMYHDAGASLVQELAITLAHISDVLSELEQCGIPKKNLAKWLQIQVPVTQKYLIEIGKLRALQLLVNKVLACNEVELTVVPIQTITSARIYTPNDADSNILRNTASIMAAAAAGAEVVSALPHNTTDMQFGLRIARNISHLLVQEGFANSTIEMANGSWYSDELTHRLATAAWDIFLELEKEGGYYALLANGKLAEICAQSAEFRVHQYAEQAEVLIGANKYPYNGEAKSTNLPWITFHENRLLKAEYLAY